MSSSAVSHLGLVLDGGAVVVTYLYSSARKEPSVRHVINSTTTLKKLGIK